MRNVNMLMAIILTVFIAVPAGILRAESPWRNYDECVSDFDVNKINLSKELSSQDAKAFNKLLTGAIICRAIMRNDVSQCKYLMYGDSYESCKRLFREYRALFDLAKTGRFSSELQVIFPKMTADFVRAFNKGDDSICGASQNCRAVIKQDERMADDALTKNLIIFIKAVKNSDAELCGRLNDNPQGRILELSQTCRALVLANEKACLECDGAKQAIEAYCNAAFPARRGTASPELRPRERSTR
ncbi:MAG: hypothetical protein Q8O22_05545 [Candidatus Omnitrophota bacterium]|nr:hypothetical protein [Candidatus Omnitrophota bacterium]